jgi:hypothetical protein
VALSGDLDQQRAALEDVAGAPVCAVAADYSHAQLMTALDAITADIREWEAQGVAIRTIGDGSLGNRVDVLAVWADDGGREELVRRYGEMVVLRSWITPLDTGSE